jgi:hypothetical protein
MSNGIKMRNAVDKPGNPYSTATLQSLHDAGTPIPALFCSDPTCRKPVRFVPRHQQNRKNLVKPVDVPAYIGLTSGSTHQTGCRFDADKRITVIVDESDPDFLAPIAAGQHELRLLLLHNGLSNQPISGGNPNGPPVTGPDSVSRKYVPSGKKLEAYLRTTADLLELRELCDSDTDLARRLTIRFGGKHIRWNDFYFEKDNYCDAWEAVKCGGGQLHPIALLGEVKSVVPPKAGTGYTSVYLNCKSAYHSTDNPDKLDVYEVSVQHTDAKWLAGFALGTRILMFGLWEYKDAMESKPKAAGIGKPPPTYITHKLILRPKFKQQLHAAF